MALAEHVVAPAIVVAHVHVDVPEHKHRLVNRPPRALFIQPCNAAQDGLSIFVAIAR